MILNNDIRLKIINILHINKRHAYYTELLNILDLPASSNLAYHMKILHNTLIVEKDENGRYYLTEYGIQSSLKYKLMNGTDSFPLIKAHLGISVTIHHLQNSSYINSGSKKGEPFLTRPRIIFTLSFKS